VESFFEILLLDPTDSSGNKTVKAPAGGVTVLFETASGSATGGSCGNSGVDFQQTSNFLTIPAGRDHTWASVRICADNLRENRETFTVTLSDSTNAVVGTPSATIALFDDDSPAVLPRISIWDPNLLEPMRSAHIAEGLIAVQQTLVGCGTARDCIALLAKQDPTNANLKKLSAIFLGGEQAFLSLGRGPIANEDILRTAAGSILGNTGISVLPALITNDGGSLITNDGGSLITNDGGSLITNDGGSLIAVGSSKGVFNDGNELITNDGGSVISNDGASLVPPSVLNK
jgi:hypothetical protein